MKKRAPFTLKTEPNENRNVSSFLEEEFIEAKEEARASIATKGKSHLRLQRASIKVCYSKKNASQNIEHLFG